MGIAPSSGPHVLRFGAFEADLHSGELRKNGARIRLPEQPFHLLTILLEHPGEMVTREDLQKRLWPDGTFVDFEQGLNAVVKRLREALEDPAESPRLIETLPRRGYRFIGSLAARSGRIESLAVLPLDNLSRDPEQEYFTEGLTEALITSLAKISALRVISRTTAMRYRKTDKALPQIARELNVDAVVEGTVLRSGDRVRISAQLVHAQTDTHLWADNYDRDLRDILALHAEVARAIAREIRIKLTPLDQARLAQVHTVDADAYEAYLKGRYHWNRRGEETLTKAVHYFQQAIAKDPTYAAAYSGLADCHSILGWWSFVPPDEGCGKGKTLALKAVELDPDLSEGHASLAWATAYYDYDFPKCEKEFRRATELNPKYAMAHGWFGLTLSMIRSYEEAAPELGQALRLDPSSAIVSGMPALACWFARQYDESTEQYQKAVDLEPAAFQYHLGLGLAYLSQQKYGPAIAEMELAVQLGRRASLTVAFLASAYAAAGREHDAERLLGELNGLSNPRYVSPYVMAWIFADLKQTDKALDHLEAGYRERAAWMVWMNKDPRFDRLRSEPRFQALLRRMNFPP